MARQCHSAALPVSVVSSFHFQPHFARSADRLWKAPKKAFQALTAFGKLCPNKRLYRTLYQ
jgi:hypothetical protein